MTSIAMRQPGTIKQISQTSSHVNSHINSISNTVAITKTYNNHTDADGNTESYMD